MNKKSQFWYLDYILTIVIISAAVILFLKSSSNILTTTTGNNLDELRRDSKTISSSLIQAGIPQEWNYADLSSGVTTQIGLTDGEYRLSPRKVRELLKSVSDTTTYYNLKLLFGTRLDYLVHFQDEINDEKKVMGICYMGKYNNFSDTTLPSPKIAYYYNGESLMRPSMEALDADIYSNLGNLINNINIGNYEIVFFENPMFSEDSNFLSNPNLYTDPINTFVSGGNTVFLTQNVSLGVNYMLGANFIGIEHKDNTINVNNNYQDQFLNMNYCRDKQFKDGLTLSIDTNDPNVINTNLIADYIGFDDPAVIQWNYSGGSVYFIGDLELEKSISGQSSYSGSAISKDNIVDEVTIALEHILGEGSNACGDFDLNEIITTNGDNEPSKVLRTERFVYYNKKIIKMVIHTWV